MILCQACGGRNDNDAVFCRSCGAFLEWTGQHVSQPATVASAPAAPGPHAMPNAVDAPLAPPASPMPVLPEAALPRRAPPPPPEESWVARPDDRICPRCSRRNPVTRHFCMRCGMVLAAQAQPPPPPPVRSLPWWRRLLHHLETLRDGRENADADGRGHRHADVTKLTSLGRHVVRADAPPPSPQQLLRKALSNPRALIALVVVIVLAIVLLPVEKALAGGVAGAFHAVRSAIAPAYAPVHPVQAYANASLSGHPPALVIDGLTTTYWAASDPAPTGGDPVVTLVFDHPVDIAKIGVTSGAAGTPQDFLVQSRPQQLHIAFSDGSSASLTLQDTHSFQGLDAEANQVASVAIDIASVYRGEQQSTVALTEIEFFTRQ